jgi:hypothetical protein
MAGRATPCSVSFDSSDLAARRPWRYNARGRISDTPDPSMSFDAPLPRH